MSYRSSLIAGITFALLSVAFGAFGAHALKEMLIENGREATFELAVRYQFFHALALILTSVIMLHSDVPRQLRIASSCFTTGIIIFSGSLYVLSLTGMSVLGAITPIGGIAFIAGWLFMLVAAIREKKKPLL